MSSFGSHLFSVWGLYLENDHSLVAEIVLYSRSFMHIHNTAFQTKTVVNNVLFSTWVHNPLHAHFLAQNCVCVYIYIYMTGQKGAHARGSALQLKIKHFWKLFLFEMLCTCMNEWIYSPDNFSNQTGWFQDLVVARWKRHRKNRYPCVEWFWSLRLKRNRKHVE